MSTQTIQVDDDALERAMSIIAGAEANLGPLSDGQRRDLLMDNTAWDSQTVRDVVAALDDPAIRAADAAAKSALTLAHEHAPTQRERNARIESIYRSVRQHMSGGGCPTPGCIGELAIIAPRSTSDADGRTIYWAACYIWDASFSDSAKLAGWFRAAGAESVTVAHVLYDDDNGDRDGKAGHNGDCRAWHVEFLLKATEARAA